MTDDAMRSRAERVFQQRSLNRLSDAIADPGMRGLAKRFASGEVSAAEFVSQMQRSTAAMRGLNRYVRRYVTLTDGDLAAIRAGREREIEQIAAELARPQRRPRAEEEESWEDHSWLVE